MKILFNLTISDSDYDRLLCDYLQARGGDSMLGQTFASDLDAALTKALGEHHRLVVELDTATGKVVVAP